MTYYFWLHNTHRSEIERGQLKPEKTQFPLPGMCSDHLHWVSGIAVVLNAEKLCNDTTNPSTMQNLLQVYIFVFRHYYLCHVWSSRWIIPVKVKMWHESTLPIKPHRSLMKVSLQYSMFIETLITYLHDITVFCLKNLLYLYQNYLLIALVIHNIILKIIGDPSMHIICNTTQYW